MFIGKYNKSLIITYLGVAFAIISYFNLANSAATSDETAPLTIKSLE